MRKWIVLFLSLLVMAGSLIPCCPADNCQEEQSSMLSSHPEEEQESGDAVEDRDEPGRRQVGEIEVVIPGARLGRGAHFLSLSADGDLISSAR